MAELGNKHILVVDLSGSYTFIAERLAKDFGKVKYFSQWMTGFSTSREFLPGLGLPDVERIADIYEEIEKVDAFMFTDVGWGGLQEWLRHEGWPVFGSGAAQTLEIDRLKLKEELVTEGMDVAECRVVTGMDELRKLLAKEKDLYVKFSYFRGDAETYHHKDWFRTETWFNNLAVQLGPYGKLANFLVEDPIEGEAVEVGCDGYAVGGKLPQEMLWGYEVKDAAFLGSTDPMPARLRQNLDAFGKILERYEYTGILSTECRVTEDREYLIDATCRCPSPPSEVQCAIIENYSDIVWEGANGRLIEPDFKKRYGAMVVLKSDWVIEHPLALAGLTGKTFVHGHFEIDNKDYAVVPEEFAEFAGAVGIGNSLSEAIEEALDAAESVSGYQVRYDSDAFSEGMDTIKAGEKLGLSWANVSKIRKAG